MDIALPLCGLQDDHDPYMSSDQKQISVVNAFGGATVLITGPASSSQLRHARSASWVRAACCCEVQGSLASLAPSPWSCSCELAQACARSSC